jgi:hypothetical protein
MCKPPLQVVVVIATNKETSGYTGGAIQIQKRVAFFMM